MVSGEADQSALSKNPHQAQSLSLLVACVLTTPRPKKENRPLQNRIKIEFCVVAQPGYKCTKPDSLEEGEGEPTLYFVNLKKTIESRIYWNPLEPQKPGSPRQFLVSLGYLNNTCRLE